MGDIAQLLAFNHASWTLIHMFYSWVKMVLKRYFGPYSFVYLAEPVHLSCDTFREKTKSLLTLRLCFKTAVLVKNQYVYTWQKCITWEENRFCWVGRRQLGILKPLRDWYQHTHGVWYRIWSGSIYHFACGTVQTWSIQNYYKILIYLLFTEKLIPLWLYGSFENHFLVWSSAVHTVTVLDIGL